MGSFGGIDPGPLAGAAPHPWRDSTSIMEANTAALSVPGSVRTPSSGLRLTTSGWSPVRVAYAANVLAHVVFPELGDPAMRILGPVLPLAAASRRSLCSLKWMLTYMLATFSAGERSLTTHSLSHGPLISSLQPWRVNILDLMLEKW